MSIDFRELLRIWPQLLGSLVLVLVAKVAVTGILLRLAGSRPAVAAETAWLMASPSETTLILLGAAAAVGTIDPQSTAFWQTVTALGLTLTPLLANVGRWVARRVDREAAEVPTDIDAAERTIIFGFGRVGQMVADMLTEHKRPYLAVESDIDMVLAAREAGYDVLFGDVARAELVERLKLGHAAALVLTMNDPVLTVKLARRIHSMHPELTIVARARDTSHAATLYRAGVTDAVPETLESSLQLSEAVLIDLGLAMGPVIASIHEKRSEMRAEIMAEGELAKEPRLGRRTARNSVPHG